MAALVEENNHNAKQNLLLAQFYDALVCSGGDQPRKNNINVNVVHIFIEQGIDINFQANQKNSLNKDSYCCVGYTMLHFAVEERHLHSVDVLLNHGADYTLKSATGETALHKAIEFVKHRIHCEGDFSSKLPISDIQGKLQAKPIANAILKAHIKTDNRSNPSNKDGFSHFHIACIINNIEAVEFFLKAGVSVNQAIDCGSWHFAGFTALHLAARYSNLEVAELLLKHGADISLKDAKGMTALDSLLERNLIISDFIHLSTPGPCAQVKDEIQINQSIVQLILKTGNIDFSDLSELHIISTFDNYDLSEYISNNDVNINAAVRSDHALWPGYTALHFAAHSNMKAASILIKSGANLYARDTKHVTPLDLLLRRYSTIEYYSLLKETDLNNIILTDGTTKLIDLIHMMSDLTVLELFFAYVSNVNIKVPLDSPVFPGCTPLHLAIMLKHRTKNIFRLYLKTDYMGKIFHDRINTCSSESKFALSMYIDRILLCLRNGCRMDIQNADGSTPLHLAFDMEETDIVLKLLDECNQGILTNPSNVHGVSHFHIACFMSNRTFIERYLNLEGDVNAPTKISFTRRMINDGTSTITIRANSTPLHIAVMLCDLDIVRLLIRHGADINSKDSFDFTPIHLLMSRNSSISRNIAKLFISTNQILKNQIASAGLSYLHVACYVNNAKIVEKLLRQGVDVNAKIEIGIKVPEELSFLLGFYKRTPLDIAASYKNCGALINILLRHNAETCRTGKNNSALHIKSFAKFHLNHLDEKNLYVHAVDDTGLTLLHLACLMFNKDLIRKLLEAGADPNKKVTATLLNNYNEGFTPLHVLIYHSRNSRANNRRVKNIIKLFVDHNVDLTIEDDDGLTPLLRAIEVTDFKDANLLLGDFLLKKQTDYSKNPVNRQGVSHFHFACQRNNIAVVKKFIKGGVDINQPTNYFIDYRSAHDHRFGGYTPLHYAVFYGRYNIVKLLLKNGADLTVKDSTGNTPLYVAFISKRFRLNIIRYLLKKGADIMTKNFRGETPFEMLLKSHNSKEKNIDFFLKLGYRANVFNPVSREGMIALALTAHPKEHRPMEKPAFKTIIRASDITSISDAGFNAIHNIVSSTDYVVNHSRPSNVAISHYIEGIGKLMELGCDLDLQNKQGKTPLHLAFEFKNLNAIIALLRKGPDINIPDKNGKTAFYYTLKMSRYAGQRIDILYILEPMVHYIWKMVFSGIWVDSHNELAYNLIPDEMRVKTSMRNLCMNEMDRMKDVKIDSSWTLHDLLSEARFNNAEYPEMTLIELKKFEEFFEPTNNFLAENFPQLQSLLRLQYRKAFKRFELLENATVVLYSCGITLPDLCRKVILKFFKNHELEYLLKFRGTIVPLPSRKCLKRSYPF